VDVNTRDKDSKTPLHWASVQGRLKAARVLLEHGADVEAEDDKGKTPFQLASGEGHGEVMKLLSEHGAKQGGSSES
jgi:ankyrin repeat protein